MAALFCLAAAWVSAAAGMSVDIETTPAGEVFPALELSQSADSSRAPAVAGSGLLRIRFHDARPATQVRLTISTPGLRAPSVIDARVEAGTVLRPRLDWDPRALRSMRGTRSQVLRVSVTGKGMRTIEQSLDIRVHPLDEALYFVRDGDARIDLGWAFAAWVDPFDPVVDEMIALAGLDMTAPNWTPDNNADRVRVARALWLALERHGLRYADEGAGISQGPEIYSQRVRLLSSTWDDRVANCLDGSVLIASALERLGIGSFLVLVPGHAFVGFYSDSDKREAEFLETTFLGQQAPAGFSSVAESAEQVRRRATRGFEAARKAGRARYRSAVPRLDGRHRPDYALIDISMARAYGIMPLAVGRKDGSATAAPLPSVGSLQTTPAILSP
ncbi:hypothetical protein [Dokdonella sp.]|uniref:hypothetical protein n=1 Tax=Dokdonella sp. TaxID=2291710 RepID=UPI00352980A2